jgi:transposase
LRALGFEGVVPEATGRPAYHPATMLKIYVYGYINQIASSRRVERETQRIKILTQPTFSRVAASE